MNENFEARESKNPDSMIYATNMNLESFPHPDKLYPVDEQGNKVQKKDLPSEDLIITHYWAKKNKQIALLGLVSAGIPFAILVQETAIFDSIFETLASAIMYLFSLIVGLIF